MATASKCAVMALFMLMSMSCGFSPAAAKKRAYERGQICLRTGKYADASLEFKKALQKDARFGDAFAGLAMAELKQDHLWNAYEAFSQASTLLPRRTDIKEQFADITLRLYLADKSRPMALYQKLRAAADDLLAENSKSFAGTRIEAYLAMTDTKPEAAASLFRKAHEINPDQADVAASLTEMLFLTGQAAEAETGAKAFIQKHKAFGPLYDILYKHYLDAKELGAAEALLQAKAANNPEQLQYTMQLCQHYWRFGQHAKATELIEQMLAKRGAAGDARLKAGDFYASVGKWEDARRQFELGRQEHPKDRSYDDHLAQMFLGMGNIKDASAVLERTVAEHPDDDQARASQAALKAATGRPEDQRSAIQAFQKLVAKDGANLLWRAQLAAAYKATGDTEEERKQYLEILNRNAEDMKSLRGIADIAIARHQFVEAQHYADRMLKLEPANSAARLLKSACLANTGHLPEARIVLVQLMHDYPALLEARLQLGLLELAERQYGKAEGIFRSNYRPGGTDVRALKGLVQVYGAEGRWQQAISLIREEQKRAPDSQVLRRLLGDTAAQAGDYDAALAEYHNLERAAPDHAEIAAQIGLVYQAKHDFAHAIEYLEKAKAAAPHDAFLLALLARALDESGRRQEAAATYRDSLRYEPNNPGVKNNLAYLLAQSGGNLDEALQLAERAVKTEPDNIMFVDTLGMVYLKRQNVRTALEVFRTISAKEPRNAGLRLHYAMALLAGGNGVEAQKELRAALELHPGAGEEREIRALLSRN